MMIGSLDRLKVDWRDFRAASRLSSTIAKEICANRLALRELVYRVGENEYLLGLSERHLLLDYLVIYDALDRGFRIRINMGTGHNELWAHDHRFSFSTYILSGGYRHTIFASPTSFENDPSAGVLTPLIIQEETVGACFSLHHSVMHTTEKRDDMVSFFVRGPSEKASSCAYDLAANTRWDRKGGEASSNPTETRNKMNQQDYLDFCEKLKLLEII